MNNIRLGLTETTLLFVYFLNLSGINNQNCINTQRNLCNWLCSTSGFYSKEIIGTYFNFEHEKVKNSQTYNSYFGKLLNFLKENNNYHLELCFHQLPDDLLIYKEKFLNYIHYYDKQKKCDFLQFLDNKHILIINNLGSLMKKQFESGNIKKINSNFPDNVKSIQYFENGYSFFNNGPDQDILVTANKLCNKIKLLEFHGAVISAGAYSFIIADYILNNMKKTVYVIGGGLPFYFGISINRTKHFHNNSINEYFIDVPVEMRPEGYEKIENGCYW